MATVAECYETTGGIIVDCDGCGEAAAWCVDSMCLYGHGGTSVVCHGCLWSVLTRSTPLRCTRCARESGESSRAEPVQFNRITDPNRGASTRDERE